MVSSPLKADAFASLLRPNVTSLLPQRPCFAPFPTDTGKRKAGEHSQRKEKLPAGSFFRSLKMRLKPTKAQAVVLRRWMGAAQAHYNTAVDIINTTYNSEREDRYLEGLRQDHPPYMNPEGTRDNFYWYQVMESGQICDSGQRVGFSVVTPRAATLRRRASPRPRGRCCTWTRPTRSDPTRTTRVPARWREVHSDETEGETYSEATCDGDGLREAVHDVLSAEPDFEKMAPSARAVFKDMRWTQEPPRHILDAAVQEALDARATNLGKLSVAARTKNHHFKLQFRSLRNLSRTPTQSLILEASRTPGSKSQKTSGPISKFTAASGTNGDIPRRGKSARSRADFLMHFATGTAGMKGLGPIRGTDSRATVDWLLGVGYTQHESRLL